jgi:F-type H+-transporting ATPase subunit delta
LSNSALSRRYARALFSLGQEDGSFEKYGQELAVFANFCDDNEEFGKVIANPIFSIDDRKKVLQVVLKKSNFSIIVQNFLNLLLDKDRMGAINEIEVVYGELTDEASDIARAEIRTAKPLTDKAREKIEKSLQAMTSKKIRSDVKEDKDLIGGVVVQIGDLVLDGSIKAQLEGLKESFKRGE